MPSIVYLVLGACFGVVLTQAEVLSWFRIQEMFRFQSPRMFLIICSAVAVAAVSLQILKRAGARSASGEPIAVPPKAMGRGVSYLAGGTMFGLGWALTGACPGPLFALAAGGVPVMFVAIVAALAGTWAYGYLRPRLPH